MNSILFTAELSHKELNVMIFNVFHDDVVSKISIPYAYYDWTELYNSCLYKYDYSVEFRIDPGDQAHYNLHRAKFTTRASSATVQIKVYTISEFGSIIMKTVYILNAIDCLTAFRLAIELIKKPQITPHLGQKSNQYVDLT